MYKSFTTTLYETQQTLKLAIPLITSMLAQKGIQLIATLMMGRLGTTALAAGALGYMLIMTLLIICIGTLSAVGILIARANGENKPNHITHILHQGCYSVLVLSIVAMLAIWRTPQILVLLKEDPLLIRYTTEFLHAFIPGIPGALGFILLREFIAAQGQSKISMLTALIAMPFNVCVSYFLSAKLGLAGIGYSCAITEWFMFFCMLLYAMQHPIYSKQLQLKKFSLPDLATLKEIFKLGLPTGILFGMDVGIFAFATIIMGLFGIVTLAAHQIAMQCGSMSFTLPMGLSIATSIRMSAVIGRRELLQAEQIAYIGIGIALTIILGVNLVFWFAPLILVNIFLTPQQMDYSAVAKMAIAFLHFAALFQFMDALQVSINGALRGLKDTFIPMLLALAAYWILGPLAGYLYAFYFNLGGIGLWAGLGTAISVLAILLYWRFYKLITHLKSNTNFSSDTIYLSSL